MPPRRQCAAAAAAAAAVLSVPENSCFGTQFSGRDRARIARRSAQGAAPGPNARRRWERGNCSRHKREQRGRRWRPASGGPRRRRRRATAGGAAGGARGAVFARRLPRQRHARLPVRVCSSVARVCVDVCMCAPTRSNGVAALSPIVSLSTTPPPTTPLYLPLPRHQNERPYQLASVPTHITGWISHSLATSSLLRAVGIDAGA